jgi:hypothetical protein
MWRQGSATLFGYLAKSIIPADQRRKQILFLNSIYVDGPDEFTVRDGNSYPKPKVQIQNYEMVPLDAISTPRGSTGEAIYNGIMQNLQTLEEHPGRFYYVIVHVVTNMHAPRAEPLYRISSVGTDAPRVSAPEEYLLQINSGVMDIRTLC